MSTWILLRGLTREVGHWGDFPARLQIALGENVLALDLPGNGTRCSERSLTSIDAMAADCRAQLDRLAVQRPVGIVGLSLGAMVATRWAHDEPSSIDRLVLINTSLRPLAPMHWRLRPAAAARLLWRLLTANARRLEETVLELTSARHDSAVIDNWLALHALHPVSRANALRQLLAAARFSAPPSAARPTLLLAGNGDRLVDPRCSERIARAWGMPLAMHPWAGHDLPLDDAAWVIDQIRLWLDAARGAASATTDSD